MVVGERVANWVGGRSMLVAMIVAIAFFIEMLDATIIVAAIPQMAGDFGVDATRMSLGITAYIMAAAACLTASGWMADRIGTRTLFCGAIGLFTLASLICGLAQNFETFIAARAVQGMSAAMMSPVGRLVVLRTSEKKDLMRALSALIWPGLVAQVLGPPLGGWITDVASWHWIFFVNIPVGVAAMALVLAYVPNEKKAPIPFDIKGFLMTSIGLICLTYGFDLLADRAGLQVYQGAAFVLLAFILGWFSVRHMKHAKHPLVRLDALKVQSFFVSNVTGGTLSRAAISAAPFLLALMLQLAFGLTATQAGALLMIYMIANLATKPFTNPIIARFGLRTVLVASSLFSGITIAACALVDPRVNMVAAGVVLALAGIGRSMQLISITMVNFVDITPDQRQPASVLSSLTQQIGMGGGVALGALLLAFSQSVRGEVTPGLADFQLALSIAGGLSALSALLYIRLAPDVGDEVSGRKRDLTGKAGS